MTIRFDGLTLDWLGYATARIALDDGPVIYTDPGRYGVLTGEWADRYGGHPHPVNGPLEPQDGDLILVTHDHHYDDDGVRRVAADHATVLVHSAVDVDRIAGHSHRTVDPPESLPYDVRRVESDERVVLESIKVDVLPAYNLPDGPNVRGDGTPYHQEGYGCGYVVTLGEHRICWPGDSDRLDIHDVLDVTILLPSIASNFTMDRHDAAALAADLAPELVLPIHYNTFDELVSDSRAFAADVAAQGVPVVLDEQ